jgi:RNA polymerase sigma-70 factor, ECF subfamily
MASCGTDRPRNGRATHGTAARAAMVALPPELRAVLELAFFGGLDYRQIAARLHLPPATVTKRLRLALVALAVQLAHQEPSPID